MPSKFLNLSTDDTLGGNSPSDDVAVSQKAIKKYVDDHGGGGSVSIDNKSITTNASDQLQTVGVIDQNNTSTALKVWSGDEADLPVTKDANTFYATEETVSVSLLETLYPVGSIYITTNAACPLASLISGSTWTLRQTGIVTGLANTAPVIGNGMTLGLTDGITEGSSCEASDNRFSSNTQGLGSAVGTTVSGNNAFANGVTLGITTDPTKSGIETSANGLYLYFYVGETVQDANIIAAASVLTKVANSIDRTVKSDRETVVGWGMPDYSAKISVGSSPATFTAPSNGWVYAEQNGTYNAAFSVEVNGYLVWYQQSGSSFYRRCCFIPVSKGDVLTFTGVNNITFYPSKGA